MNGALCFVLNHCDGSDSSSGGLSFSKANHFVPNGETYGPLGIKLNFELFQCSFKACRGPSVNSFERDPTTACSKVTSVMVPIRAPKASDVATPERYSWRFKLCEVTQHDQVTADGSDQL